MIQKYIIITIIILLVLGSAAFLAYQKFRIGYGSNEMSTTSAQQARLEWLNKPTTPTTSTREERLKFLNQ